VSLGIAIAPDAVVGVAMAIGSVDVVGAVASVAVAVDVVDDDDAAAAAAMAEGCSIRGDAMGLSMQRTVRHD